MGWFIVIASFLLFYWWKNELEKKKQLAERRSSENQSMVSESNILQDRKKRLLFPDFTLHGFEDNNFFTDFIGMTFTITGRFDVLSWESKYRIIPEGGKILVSCIHDEKWDIGEKRVFIENGEIQIETVVEDYKSDSLLQFIEFEEEPVNRTKETYVEMKCMKLKNLISPHRIPNQQIAAWLDERYGELEAFRAQHPGI